VAKEIGVEEAGPVSDVIELEDVDKEVVVLTDVVDDTLTLSIPTTKAVATTYCHLNSQFAWMDSGRKRGIDVVELLAVVTEFQTVPFAMPVPIDTAFELSFYHNNQNFRNSLFVRLLTTKMVVGSYDYHCI
jgi:hypothetical protein